MNNPKGLVNLGNTCYLNSAIQSIIHIPILQEYFKDKFKNEVVESRKEFNFLIEFIKLLRAAQEENDIKVLKPLSFKKELGLLFSDYNGRDQHDSGEALAKILDFLHDALSFKAIISVPEIGKDRETKLNHLAWKCMKEQYESVYSFFVHNFYGQHKITMKCQVCQSLFYRFDPFMVLSLGIYESCNTIYDCFDKFQKIESLEEVNCETCNEKRNFKRQNNLWRVPKILLISLNRYDMFGKKINRFIDFPTTNLQVNIAKKKYHDRISFDLVSVINHYGRLNGGHYTSFTKNKEGRWFEFDDDGVKEMKMERVVSDAAYFLVYQRKNLKTKMDF